MRVPRALLWELLRSPVGGPARGQAAALEVGLLASTVLIICLARGSLSPMGTSVRLCVMRFQSPCLCPEVGHLVIWSGSY